MSNNQCDSEGRPLKECELPTDIITVWVIEPHLDKSFDRCCVRDYHDAVVWAKHTIETLMDSYDDDDEQIVVTIKRIFMPLGDYESLEQPISLANSKNP